MRLNGLIQALFHSTLRRASLSLLCLVLMLLPFSAVAEAAEPFGENGSTPFVFFNPELTIIDTTVSPTAEVSVEVANALDVFAFDLFVRYDAALLRVSQVALGDFLGMGLLCMDQINNPGLVHYNCTRFGVDTGVSGSGVLLTLTFEALGKGGDTLLSLEGSELYNWPGAQPVDLSLEDGAVSVRPFRTFLPLILSASGQGGTVLAVDPAQSSVEVNGQREISLLVSGAVSLNAFDVQVEYDAALLSLSKWEFGDLLSNLAVVKRDDLPGSFRLVATQLATAGVSGDGVLLKLTFGGKLTGSSAINITKAEFARSEGGLSLPELQNGNITIIPSPTDRNPHAHANRHRHVDSDGDSHNPANSNRHGNQNLPPWLPPQPKPPAPPPRLPARQALGRQLQHRQPRKALWLQPTRPTSQHQPERRLNLASQRMRAAQSWRKQQGTLPAQPIRRVEMDISCSEALATISTLVW